MAEKTTYFTNVTNYCIIYTLNFFTHFSALITRRESKMAETCRYIKIKNNVCVRRESKPFVFLNKYLPLIKLQTKFIDRNAIKVFFFYYH